jgi:penicillin-insensitive murein endopeptidase
VQRVFVNPAIKKKLCQTWTGDRDLLGKVRPVYGHDEHFHVRLSCPPGAASCQKQAAVPKGDDCDSKGLAWWFTKEPWAPPPKPDPNKKPVKPRQVMLSDLPNACAAVLAAPARSEEDATFGGKLITYAPQPATPAAAPSVDTTADDEVPLPTPRPAR